MRRFAIGDIHGGYKALLQVLEMSKFDKDNDMLICLGDVADGWSQTPEAFEELLTIKNLIYILGNHDEMFVNCIDGMISEKPAGLEELWMKCGGMATKDAYKDKIELLKKHCDFLKTKAKLYHIEIDINTLFVHAGYNELHPGGIEKQASDILCWDRNFLDKTNRGRNMSRNYTRVFIGHTPTLNYYNFKLPMHYGNVWNLDTGAAYHGKLTMMNIDTEEYFQSDVVCDLYPEEMGRNKISRSILLRK